MELPLFPLNGPGKGQRTVGRTHVSRLPQDVAGGTGKWAEASALPLGHGSGKSLPHREPLTLTWNSHTGWTWRLSGVRESRGQR